MKNKLLITFLAFGFMALASSQVEARHHSRVNVNLGFSQSQPAYAVRQPVAVAPAPVIMQPTPMVVTSPTVAACPTCYTAPTYVVQPQPVVVQPQPVVVAQPAPRSFFNWANLGFSFRL